MSLHPATTTEPITVDGHEIPAGAVVMACPERRVFLFNGREIPSEGRLLLRKPTPVDDEEGGQ